MCLGGMEKLDALKSLTLVLSRLIFFGEFANMVEPANRWLQEPAVFLQSFCFFLKLNQ